MGFRSNGMGMSSILIVSLSFVISGSGSFLPWQFLFYLFELAPNRIRIEIMGRKIKCVLKNRRNSFLCTGMSLSPLCISLYQCSFLGSIKTAKVCWEFSSDILNALTHDCISACFIPSSYSTGRKSFLNQVGIFIFCRFILYIREYQPDSVGLLKAWHV